MGQVRSNIPPAYCLDEVQCGDTITAVEHNKLVSSVKNLQYIGTHGCELPAKLINNYLRPAHGWSQGQVAILDRMNPGNYEVITNHGLPFFADMNRFTLCFDARLLNYLYSDGVSYAERFQMEVEIVAIGYNGTAQVLASVILPGSPTTPTSFTQAGGTLSSPGGALQREVDGQWNANMLPPSGIMWQGGLIVNLKIKKLVQNPYLFAAITNLQIPGLLDWFGIRQLQLRHYRKC